MQLLEEELRGLTRAQIMDHPSKSVKQIALEFFEMAVEKESAGQLNDAADFYRKAYKLDEAVEQAYRETLPLQPTAAGPAEHKKKVKVNLKELLASLSNSKSEICIEPDCQWAVHIGCLPDEILEHVMQYLICWDQPSWVSLGLTCRRMATVAFVMKGSWRYLAQTVYGNQPAQHELTFAGDCRRRLVERPYVHFRGVYISKVTYQREGERTENSNSWNLPFRLITYYRYYRFYASGQCVKLMSVLEPERVLPHLHLGSDSTDKWLRVFHGTYTVQDHRLTTVCGCDIEGYRIADEFAITSPAKRPHHGLSWRRMVAVTDAGDETELNCANERDFRFSRVNSYPYSYL